MRAGQPFVPFNSIYPVLSCHINATETQEDERKVKKKGNQTVVYRATTITHHPPERTHFVNSCEYPAERGPGDSYEIGRHTKWKKGSAVTAAAAATAALLCSCRSSTVRFPSHVLRPIHRILPYSSVDAPCSVSLLAPSSNNHVHISVGTVHGLGDTCVYSGPTRKLWVCVRGRCTR